MIAERGARHADPGQRLHRTAARHELRNQQQGGALERRVPRGARSGLQSGPRAVAEQSLVQIRTAARGQGERAARRSGGARIAGRAAERRGERAHRVG